METDGSSGEEGENPEKTKEPETTESPEPSPVQTEEPSEEPDSEENGEDETVQENETNFSQAVINAFLESQLEYSDLEIPACVTYGTAINPFRLHLSRYGGCLFHLRIQGHIRSKAS